MSETVFQYSCKPKACNFIKKESLAIFCEISKNALFYRTPLVTDLLICETPFANSLNLNNKRRKTQNYQGFIKGNKLKFRKTDFTSVNFNFFIQT